MNTFYEHHENSIRFGYRCFDRLLINGLIQPFQQPERVVGFFNTYRQQYPVSKAVLTDIATQYQRWVIAQAKTWACPIVEAPAGRRDAFVEPHFRRAKADQVVVIVKGREPARILTAIGKDDRWHLQYARRWVIQYNFYPNDAEWGRMFVRLCPYFPFSARVCLNQHHWLATRMRAERMRFHPAWCRAIHARGEDRQKILAPARRTGRGSPGAVADRRIQAPRPAASARSRCGRDE